MLSPELIPIHERLINIRRQLVALLAKETASQAQAAAASAASSQSSTPLIRSRSGTQSRPPEEESLEAEMESKTPTKDMPNPEPIVTLRVKAELKPLQEELRRIDSLSILLPFSLIQLFMQLAISYCAPVRSRL